MKIKINDKILEVGKESNVSDALILAKVNPETVLVKKKNKLIPHDALLKDGDVLELVTVISGG